MALWRPLARGLRALFRAGQADCDVDAEVRHYLEEAAAALEESGLSREEARRAARFDAGSPIAIREEVRASGWEHAVGTLGADLRYGWRRLIGAPVSTAVIASTLALGIGASAAVFSAIHPLLIEPLPYPGASRILAIWDRFANGERAELTFGTYRELQARARSFEALAVMKPWQPTITGDAEPERFEGQRVSADYFRVLGVPPVIGRDFTDADDRLNGPNVTIISDGLWRRRFAADYAIVGRMVTLNDVPFTIIGVMPAGFENVLAPSAALWAPLQYDRLLPPQGREWGHHLRMTGRLRPGVSAALAAGEIDTIARTPLPEFTRMFWASMARGLTTYPLQDDVTRGIRPALVAVSGAVVVMLLIACVNVANLLLARGSQRHAELAMRIALGAGRSRVIRQLFTESALLVALGGAFGLVVAAAGIRGLAALAPPALPRVDAMHLDRSVLAFAIGLTTLVGVVVGLAPALSVSRDLHLGLQQVPGRTTRRHQLTRRTLVVAEVALALTLLVSAGLLLQSLQRLFAVDPGFQPSHVLTMQVQTVGRRFATRAPVDQFFEHIESAVRAIPGVTATTVTSQLPLSGDLVKYGVALESAPPEAASADQSALRYAVSPGYFQTMGIPLKSGRLLDAQDASGHPPAVVISESLARNRFPGMQPIGQRVHIGPSSGPWFTVVGVVGDVKQLSLAAGDLDAAYTTTAQWLFADNPLWLVVRARGDAAALAPAIRSAIWSVDKDQPIVRVATMDTLVAQTAAERRFALVLFEAFALAALILAATGIYGVLAGSVSERTREIGVRSALGASRAQILGMVLREGMTLASVGAAIGAGGGVVASSALVTLLYGISRFDALTYVSVAALLVGVSALACAIPAWRAARVDPAKTLRAE